MWKTGRSSVLKKTWRERVLWESYQLLKETVLRLLQKIISVKTKFVKNSRRQVSLCEEFFKDTKVEVVHHSGIHSRAENTAVFLFCILRWNERSNYPGDQNKVYYFTFHKTLDFLITAGMLYLCVWKQMKLKALLKLFEPQLAEKRLSEMLY